jgi:S1-C subfamily serine protease
MLRLFNVVRLLKKQAFMLLALLSLSPLPLYATGESFAPDPTNSVVEITTHTTRYDQTSPWNASSQGWIGTGFVIEGKRILTTAYQVNNAAYISIRPSGRPETFTAEVESIAHEVNLAILKLKDESFFDNRPALPLGDLPKPEDKVRLYGYPVGGYKISISEGIVSRIEYQPYAHSGLTFQAIQVDAAINNGSNGSPAFVNGKVIGIVSETPPELSTATTENIGYLIPAPRIKQLLEDLRDGTLDGVPELWVDYQFITNPNQKQYHKLTPQQTGILVNRLCAHTDAATVLQVGDVITAIDGKPITEAGFIQTNGKQYSNFQSHIDLRQIDDIVTLDIIRGGYSFKQNLKLNQKSQTSKVDESSPRYFIDGGFVFLATRKPPACEEIGEEETGEPQKATDKVEIVQVLPSSSNIGFHEAAPMTIETVNGSKFTSLEEFYNLVKSDSSKNIVLENEKGYQVVINRPLADSEHASLLDKYHIQKSQSADVDEWSD